jgi:hypothetical protein
MNVEETKQQIGEAQWVDDSYGSYIEITRTIRAVVLFLAGGRYRVIVMGNKWNNTHTDLAQAKRDAERDLRDTLTQWLARVPYTSLVLTEGAKIEVLCRQTAEHPAETIPAVVLAIPSENYYYIAAEPDYTGHSGPFESDLIFDGVTWYLDSDAGEPVQVRLRT